MLLTHTNHIQPKQWFLRFASRIYLILLPRQVPHRFSLIYDYVCKTRQLLLGYSLRPSSLQMGKDISAGLTNTSKCVTHQSRGATQPWPTHRQQITMRLARHLMRHADGFAAKTFPIQNKPSLRAYKVSKSWAEKKLRKRCTDRSPFG